MNSPVTLSRHGDIALLRIDNPPVNALSPGVVAGLVAAIDAFEADASYKALLLHGEGRTFVAGGDISSFDLPDFTTQPFNGTLARIEALGRPVVAALHGTVLGGGLELALACHWRVAHPKTQLGLPEVKLGILPGSLGTQRLPRVVGAELALDLIASGRSIGAAEARELGLVDELSDAAPLQAGIAFTEALLARGAGPRRISERMVATESLAPDFFERALADAARRKPFHPSARNIVRAVQASLLPFAEGEAAEARLFEELRVSPESKAMRHLFFAERLASKIPGLPRDTTLRPVRSVGVLGAGTMGGGIAMNFANAGIPTVLVETSQAALDRGLGIIRANYEASAAKGRLTTEQVEARMALLRGSLDDAALADCDLVIEAVFENMDLKKQVCARLGAVCKPGAIIATNTSTLDVDVLAEATGRPADVVGMHFFSPANVMRLLEVVRGAKTAPEVLATVMQLARTIGKVAVVSGVCYGFIGNRMAEVYMREAEFLMMEGASPAQIDGAVEALGMAMGPCRMLDMAGIDVGAKTVIEYGKAGGLPPDDSYRAVVRKMFELGRFGQKTGAGYYRYDGRKPVDDPETARIAAELAAQHGIARRDDIPPQEIVERLLYPLINEGARILEEGIAYRPGDIDMVWVAGYGFPDHRGGPVHMADAIGLPQIAGRLAHYANTRGNPHGYWSISPLLASLAAQGKRLSDWQAA
ncbi:3-hydroxyacyl-CoA dehydrogenase NAD-binding domain-containing protein [Variovorax saccharolyticus]|uniref:3-hydroxyacyl-CoA dehydrogenase NAD-binding domain-containing protein n=1 Tax=Variovorax saccharolyticus TaxID=3053516 RepID=UPI002575BF1E|nr:3-hydroxyacyl-CoA dehydrogenase NAD-binding domain-containing protein [Variovorax sp. J31P216]MDM0024577.1 3-hydroxyacyl-CoA dehydrogenase NAD-binding domain-containing protein [Variovorax sp. J31P216]